jgi:hypothetical protein
MTTNSDMPAMPSGVQQTQHIRGERPLFAGLTKREHFIGLAMQAYITNTHTRGTDEDLALVSVRSADAVLKELLK